MDFIFPLKLLLKWTTNCSSASEDWSVWQLEMRILNANYVSDILNTKSDFVTENVNLN